MSVCARVFVPTHMCVRVCVCMCVYTQTCPVLTWAGGLSVSSVAGQTTQHSSPVLTVTDTQLLQLEVLDI